MPESADSQGNLTRFPAGASPASSGLGSKPAVVALSVSVGTADGTVADVGASFNQGTLNNNFRDLADKLNEIRTALVNADIID